MNCPECGQELERKRMKVPLQLQFSSADREARLLGTKQTRTVYVCGGCNSTFILTSRLVKIQA